MRKIANFIRYAARVSTLTLATLVGGFLSGCYDHWPTMPAEPTLEQKIILNEGEDVRLGDTFMVCPWPETLRYVAIDTQNKTMKFIRPGTDPAYTRENTYDENGEGMIVIGGQTHKVKLNPEDHSLRIDLNANGIISNNDTFYVGNLLNDNHNTITCGDYFIIKSKDGGFMPFLYCGSTYGATQHEVQFDDIHNYLIRYYSLTQDTEGKFRQEIDFNGTKVIVEMVGPADEVKLSSLDGKNLECLVGGNIVANEGRSIKPGEHFLIDTMDSPSPKGEVWKYVGKNPADSILEFRKFGPTGFETQEITLSNGEATLLTSGFSYKVRMNSDQTVNIDLDKSGFIRKNEVPLLDRFVFNEKRPVAGGDVFVLENTAQTEQFHSAYRLQNIDTVNKVVYFTNLNLPQSVECSYSSTDGKSGTLVSSGISHSFTVSEADNTIHVDMNGDGKIE